MASIAKRGEYQWRALIRRKGLPPISKTFPYKADAEAWARKVETELKEGTYRDRSEADRTSLGNALDRYLREISVKKKGRGYECNRSQVSRIKEHPIASLPMSRVDSSDAAKYRDERIKSVGANTVRLELALISHLFTIVQREWGMPYLINPVAIIKKPSIKKTARDRRLEVGEEARLLAACSEYGGVIHDVTVFAINTAMRRAEIANLRWKDIHDNIAHLEDTKNEEKRDVPLSTAALAVIKRQVRNLHDDRVFGIAPAGISRAFSRVCKRTKAKANKKSEPIKDLRFHDLRHEATSRLFEKGLNPMQVAAITGHKTLQMLKRYTHLRAEDLAKMLG